MCELPISVIMHCMRERNDSTRLCRGGEGGAWGVPATRLRSAVANAVEISASAGDDIWIDANKLAQVVRVNVFAAPCRLVGFHTVVVIVLFVVFVAVFIV
jgi:hypothetical protein